MPLAGASPANKVHTGIRFGILADTLTGKGDAASLTRLLEHFWQNRQFARDTLVRLDSPVTRVLTEMIAARLGDTALSIPTQLAAMRAALTAPAA